MTGDVGAISQFAGWFDWRYMVALMGIIGATLLLIAWQSKLSSERGANWLNYAALSLELLGLSLSVFWAVMSPDDSIMPIVFVIGWIGMLIGRAVAIHQVIAASCKGKIFQVFITITALLIAYIALYGSGLFHALNASGDAAQERLEASRPALALDTQIEQTQQRIAALAPYSDVVKAEQSQEEVEAAKAEQSQALIAAMSGIEASRAMLLRWATSTDSCETAGAVSDEHVRRTANGAPYTTKAAHACAGLRHAIQQKQTLPVIPAVAAYAERHNEYIGLQNHLVALQQQRAKLSETGQGVQSAWKPEDRFLSWMFGITAEQANSLKWLLFTAIFDVLSLLFRIQASLVLNKHSPEARAKQRFNALVDNGFTVDEALAMVGGNVNMQPAKEGVPQFKRGGFIGKGGLAELHDNEQIVSEAALTLMGSDLSRWLYDFNQWAETQQGQMPRIENYIGAASNADGVGATNTSAASNADGVGATNTSAASEVHHYHGLERVPPELSKRAGKGRVGKVDSCKDCGVDFVVKTYNGTRCPICAKKAEASYVKHQVRAACQTQGS